jgi:hypothetical protein
MLTQLETGTFGRLADDWLKAVGGRPRIAYETFAHEDLRAASQVVFGIDAIPQYVFEDARTILSLGADFLETWVSPVEHGRRVPSRALAARRARGPGHSRRAPLLDDGGQRRRVGGVPARCGGRDRARPAAARLEAKQVPALPAKEAEALTAAARTVEVEAVAKQSGVPAAKLQHMAEALVKGAPEPGGGAAASRRAGTGGLDAGGRRATS